MVCCLLLVVCRLLFVVFCLSFVVVAAAAAVAAGGGGGGGEEVPFPPTSHRCLQVTAAPGRCRSDALHDHLRLPVSPTVPPHDNLMIRSKRRVVFSKNGGLKFSPKIAQSCTVKKNWNSIC